MQTCFVRHHREQEKITFLLLVCSDEIEHLQGQPSTCESLDFRNRVGGSCMIVCFIFLPFLIKIIVQLICF